MMGHLGLRLAAVALVAVCVTPAGADTVTVDLEYQTDTLTWALYATIVDTGSGNSGDHGLAALRALVDNVDSGTVTLATDIGAIDPIDPGGPNERPAALQTAGGTVDIIYGQNINNPTSVVGGVGVGGRALIMGGTFPNASTPPTFGDDHALTTDGNFLNVAAPGPFGRALPWDGVMLNVINVTSVNLHGDFNDDAVVDAADYVVWRKALGTIYEDDDYGLWRANFGRTLLAGNGAALPSFGPLSAAVPEPTALLLLSISLATIMSSRFVPQRRRPEADARNSTIWV